MSQAALLISADVVNLYRILRQAGVTFPRMRLRLDAGPAALSRLGFRLLQRGMAQAMPQAALVQQGRGYVRYHVRAPSLCQMPYGDYEFDQRVRHHCCGYSVYPLRILISWLDRSRCIALEIHQWTLKRRWRHGPQPLQFLTSPPRYR